MSITHKVLGMQRVAKGVKKRGIGPFPNTTTTTTNQPARPPAPLNQLTSEAANRDDDTCSEAMTLICSNMRCRC